MKPRITLASGVVLFLAVPYPSSAQVSEPAREQMEAAQTDGYGARRDKKRLEEEWLEPQRLREDFGRRTSAGASAPVQSSANTPPDSKVNTSTSNGTITGANPTAAPSGRSGIVTGLGGAGPSGNSGRGHGHGPRGVVTGAGAGHSGSPGKGIVNAAGAAPATAGSAARPAGAGIVTAGGAVVAPSVTGTARPGAGIVNGAGGPPGHAHGQGRGGRH